MKKFLTTASLMVLLAACGDGPQDETPTDGGGGTDGGGTDGGGTDGGGTDNGSGIPIAIAGGLNEVSFNGTTLQVRLDALDSSNELQTYTRDASRDRPGYIAYRNQEDPLDRFFVAYAQQTAGLNAQAVLVADGGNFNRIMGGVSYSQDGAYVAPTTGMVTYSGDYVGLLNSGTPVTVPGVDPAITPRDPFVVEGRILLNADFTDNQVEGEIYNRQVTDGAGTVIGGFGEATDLALITTDINSDGTFSGGVELDNPDQTGVGSYAGTFGGLNANGVAGGIRLSGDFLTGAEGEEEYGIFVLNQCGTPGDDSAICSNANSLADTP